MFLVADDELLKLRTCQLKRLKHVRGGQAKREADTGRSLDFNLVKVARCSCRCTSDGQRGRGL